MTKLPEKELLSGTKMPRTTTGEMKNALGKLRDYLAELFGENSTDKETARKTLGIDLTEWASKPDMEKALTEKAGKNELDALEESLSRKGTPIGTIDNFAQANPPDGYLKADGAAVGRETYPDLFAVIGTTYGEGDGEATFNLPDLIGRFPQGSSMPGQKILAGLPNITGHLNRSASPAFQSAFEYITEEEHYASIGGAFSSSGTITGVSGMSDAVSNYYQLKNLNFDASDANPIYGASNTVQPPALTLLPCIKAFDAASNPGLIDITGLAQETAGKIDKEIDGIAVKYVTETFNNGTNWYRKWSDGWLEQGGFNNTSTSGNVTITFLKPYQSIPRVMAFGLEGSATTSWWICGARSLTTLYVAGSVTGYQLGFDWYACGY